jgi:membrane-bound ClpP family serine protease
VSRAGRALSVLGLLIAVIGLGVALLFGDRYLGIALLVVGAFLLVLPLSRPSLDED